MLAPGTRGIVLLLLYLGLDDKDDRPLLIDQPEENLDPKSVFDELVQLFTEAKSHRQVIMVTHNANLVINTRSEEHTSELQSLMRISYAVFCLKKRNIKHTAIQNT